jgi:hypothetical protein
MLGTIFALGNVKGDEDFAVKTCEQESEQK